MHALTILVIVLIRFLLSTQGKGKSEPFLPSATSFWIRVLLMVLASVFVSTRAHPAWTFGCLLLAFPMPAVKFLLVPAGVPNLTYYFARIVRPHSVASEAVGGATFFELRARLRRGFGLGADATRRLGRRLTALYDGENDCTVRGATVTAQGMLDALDGRWETGRELFAVVQDMRWRHAPRSARAYCQAWLLADAAQRGAYHEVVRLSRRGPTTRRRAFLAACARRLLGSAKPASKSRLVVLWLAAPSRWRGLGLLSHALAAHPRNAIELEGSGLTAATRAMVLLLGAARGSLTRRELFRAASAWQEVFESDELRARLEKRRGELDAGFDVASLESTLDDDLSRVFSELLRDSLAEDEPEGDEPPLITAAKDSLQSDLLTELEALARELPANEDQAFDGYGQAWRTWAHIRSLATTFVDVLPERGHLLYDSVGSKLWAHAVWLHSEQAWLLASDIFRWLHSIAPAESEAKRTLAENAAIARRF